MASKKKFNTLSGTAALAAKLPRRLHALMSTLPELRVLGPSEKAALVTDLTEAVIFAAISVPTLRADAKGERWTRQVLAVDVQRAMKKAGVKVASWRQDTVGRDPLKGEAPFYRILREVARVADVSIPQDAFRLKKQSDKICYFGA